MRQWKVWTALHSIYDLLVVAGRRSSIAASIVASLVLISVSSACASGTSLSTTNLNRTALVKPTTVQDSALRIGVLPNGMRYYIRQNSAPANRAQLWLAVNAGSLLEDDDQLGYAHFLEHMAFNGTEHFPGNELIDFIEDAGMRFGADMNAYTNFDETVYMLAVPTDEEALLDRGLDVLEDWAAGRITIDSAEVVAERGVVLGEWRSRMLTDTMTERIRSQVWDVIYGRDSRYRARWPIGTPQSIEEAAVEPIRRFYHDWYRPDLMAVIAVGDFDAGAIEADVRKRFGTIQSRTSARDRRVINGMDNGEPVVEIIRDKVSPMVEVLWQAPPPPESSARALIQHDLVWNLLLRYVQANLLKIREREARPFIHAELARPRLTRSMNKVAARIVTWPDSLEHGLKAVLTELEDVASGGVTAAELVCHKQSLLRELEYAAASMPSRPSVAYAREYVHHSLTGEGALLNAQQQLELAQQILPEITTETVAKAARFWRQHNGLKAIVRVPDHIFGFEPPTEESVLQLWNSVQASTPGDKAVSSIGKGCVGGTDGANDSVIEVSEPGAIVDETVHESAGVVEWKLSNGALVLFKESANDPDELMIRAWSPGGLSLLPDSLFQSPGRVLADVMNETEGVGSRSGSDGLSGPEDPSQRRLQVNLGYAEEVIDVAGSPRELQSLFELMHKQFVAPALDSASVATWARIAKYQRQSPNIHDQFDQLFARGNRRMWPSQTGIAELAKTEQLEAVHRDRFSNAADFTFIIVGAAPSDEVYSLVEQYLASLPSIDSGGERESPNDPDVAPFVGRKRLKSKVLPVERADVLLAFDGRIPTEPQEYIRERHRLQALTLVLDRRFRDRLREELGGTYGVSVQGRTYRLYDEHFRLIISFQTAPDRVEEMNNEMLEIIEAVREEGATPEELERVEIMLQRGREVALEQNDFWLDKIELYHRLKLPLDWIVSPTPLSSTARLTADDLSEAARLYLPDHAYVHITNLPVATVK